MPNPSPIDTLQGSRALRYPHNIGQPPFDKWVLFEVKKGRHVVRKMPDQAADGTLHNIAMYIPESAMNSMLSVNYETTALGPFAGKATEVGGNLIQNFRTDLNKNGFVDAASNGISQLFSNIGKLFDPETAASMAYAEITKDTSAARYGSAATGIKGNPRTDILFDAQNYREHTFEYLLTPRNADDAREISNIIHCFQRHMLPIFQGDEFLLGFPFEFKISFRDGTGKPLKHINTIGRSVLVSASVNEAAGGKVSFVRHTYEGDEVVHFPAAVKLDLVFREVVLLDRNSEEIRRYGTTYSESDT